MTTQLIFSERVLESGWTIEQGIARPKTLDETQNLLALAEECDARLKILGAGTQYRAWAPPLVAAPNPGADAKNHTGFDLGLTLRDLPGELQYDPAEGVVVAPAGMLWSDLQTQVAAAGQVLSPQFGAGHTGTVGGVIAAGLSGHDRDFYGALRHQVLGVEVLLADGKRAQCGGRLVKNVTGFALHTLFTGSRGHLGVILEVSLRVWPKPAATRTWSVLPTDATASLRAWQRMRAECIPSTSVRFECRSDGRTRWHVVAQGTQGALRDIEAQVRRAVDVEASGPQTEALRKVWQNAWCQPLTSEALWIQCQPQEAAGVFDTLQRSGTPWCEALHWWGLPELAEWRGWVLPESNAPHGWRAALEANLEELPCRWRWLGAQAERRAQGGPARPPGLQAAQEALRLEFDPKRRWQPRTTADKLAQPGF